MDLGQSLADELFGVLGQQSDFGVTQIGHCQLLLPLDLGDDAGGDTGAHLGHALSSALEGLPHLLHLLCFESVEGLNECLFEV